MVHTIIIAEAGVNHNGEVALAKKLVDAAAEAGADYVKFQTFKTELCISKNAVKAEYQKKSTNQAETQYEMVKKLELGEETHLDLVEYCQLRKIKFLSTPFDIPSVNFLNELGLDFFKIPSGEITNLPYLRAVGSLKTNLVLSTGMCDLEEIKQAINILIQAGTRVENIKVLHCNTEYPTPMSDVNLLAMQVMKRELGVEVGYSDHTLGIEVPIAAVALGATVIEKHFTLDRNMDGPDHKASLEPHELKQMVSSIRNIEKALGVPVKSPSNSEIKNRSVARKSLVAKQRIEKGEIFTVENLIAKRPGTGVSPMKWDDYIGQVANRDYHEDELIDAKELF